MTDTRLFSVYVLTICCLTFSACSLDVPSNQSNCTIIGQNSPHSYGLSVFVTLPRTCPISVDGPPGTYGVFSANTQVDIKYVDLGFPLVVHSLTNRVSATVYTVTDRWLFAGEVATNPITVNTYFGSVGYGVSTSTAHDNWLIESSLIGENARPSYVSANVILQYTRTSAMANIEAYPQNPDPYSSTVLVADALPSFPSTPSYIWFRDSVRLGELGRTITVTSAGPSESNYYEVVVDHPLGGQLLRGYRLLSRPQACGGDPQCNDQ